MRLNLGWIIIITSEKMRLNLSSIICYVKSLYLLIVDSQMNLRRSRLSSYAAAPVTLLHSKYEF